MKINKSGLKNTIYYLCGAVLSVLASHHITDTIAKPSNNATTILPSTVLPSDKQQPLTTHCGFAKAQGERDHMEDNYNYSASNNYFNVVVCDGHGQCDGNNASKAGVNFILPRIGEISKNPTLLEVQKVIYNTCEEFEMNNNGSRGGTTMALCMINRDPKNPGVITSHVGDSRVVICSPDGRVIHATNDHTYLGNPGEKERIDSRTINPRPGSDRRIMWRPTNKKCPHGKRCGTCVEQTDKNDEVSGAPILCWTQITPDCCKSKNGIMHTKLKPSNGWWNFFQNLFKQTKDNNLTTTPLPTPTHQYAPAVTPELTLGGSGKFVRVEGLIPSKSLWDARCKEWGTAITYQPTTSNFIPIERGGYIVLASDGIWDALTSEQVALFVQNFLYKNHSLLEEMPLTKELTLHNGKKQTINTHKYNDQSSLEEKAAALLIKIAHQGFKKGRSNDNMCVVVIRCS